MTKFVWAYTDVEVGTQYTPSHNSEEKRDFLKSHAICLSQPTCQHLSQGSVIIWVTSEEVVLPVAKCCKT